MTGRFGGNSDVGVSWTSDVSKNDEYGYQQGQSGLKPRHAVQGAGAVIAGAGAIGIRNATTLQNHMDNSYEKQRIRADTTALKEADARKEYKTAARRVNGPVVRNKANPMRFVTGGVKQPVKGGPTWQYRNGNRKAAGIKLDAAKEANIKEQERLRTLDAQRKPDLVAAKRTKMIRGGGVMAGLGALTMASPSIKNALARRSSGGDGQ